MLFEVDSINYQKYFPLNSNPFISESFIELNKLKADRIIRLIKDDAKPAIGLVAGIKKRVILSHFSAPFGGFHFRNEVIFMCEIDNFLVSLQSFIKSNEMEGIEITLPPDIYHQTFNAKTVNSLVRNGYKLLTPDITSWVNLQQFGGKYTFKKTRGNYSQAVRNNLSFELVSTDCEKEEIYDIIRCNRERFDRPIFMSFEDILAICKLWPVDFFKVCSSQGINIASAIVYRNHPEICFAVFWGDNEIGRQLRAMDFLVLNLLTFYKAMGFKYLDLGTSSESGIPNEGLLRFKECHETTSTLRYRFFWNAHQ
jgi:hypothetical protein